MAALSCNLSRTKRIFRACMNFDMHYLLFVHGLHFFLGAHRQTVGLRVQCARNLDGRESFSSAEEASSLAQLFGCCKLSVQSVSSFGSQDKTQSCFYFFFFSSLKSTGSEEGATSHQQATYHTDWMSNEYSLSLSGTFTSRTSFNPLELKLFLEWLFSARSSSFGESHRRSWPSNFASLSLIGHSFLSISIVL